MLGSIKFKFKGSRSIILKVTFGAGFSFVFEKPLMLTLSSLWKPREDVYTCSLKPNASGFFKNAIQCKDHQRLINSDDTNVSK